MKKFFALLLALVLTMSLVACGGGDKDSDASGGTAPAGDTQAAGDTSPDAAPADGGAPAPSFTTVEEGKLHMSTEAGFPPYEMTADDGGYNGTGFEGIDVEVAGAIAEKLGLELVIDDMGFNAALTAVQQGQSDIAMAGITITEDRQAVMDFSDSYATGVQVVIVKADSPAVQSIDDLASAALIGCQADTTGYIYASDTPENGGYGADHVIAYDTGALAVMALANGQIDAVIIDNEPAKAFVAANEGLEILEGEWVVEDYAIGFAKGNDALREAVNAAMAELKADGTFQGIVDKYITAD